MICNSLVLLQKTVLNVVNMFLFIFLTKLICPEKESGFKANLNSGSGIEIYENWDKA